MSLLGYRLWQRLFRRVGDCDMDAVLDTLRLFGRDESSCASMTMFLAGTLGMNPLTNNQGVRCLQPYRGPLIIVQQANRLPPGVEVGPGEIAIDLGVRNVDMLWRELEWKGVTLLTGVMGLDHERAFFAHMPGGYLLRLHQC